jgi:hypothetical protein
MVQRRSPRQSPLFKEMGTNIRRWRAVSGMSHPVDSGYLDRRGSFPISPDLPLHAARSWAPDGRVLSGAFDDASPR